jgi:hypothetical protein
MRNTYCFLLISLFLLPLYNFAQSYKKEWIQDLNLQRLNLTIAPSVQNQVDFSPKITSNWQNAKTSAGLDTIDRHFVRCARNAVYFTQKNTQFDGYWAGTFNRPLPLASGDSVYINQHGLSLRFEVGRDRVAKVKGVLVLFAPGTGVQGTADSLASIIWAKSEPQPGNIRLSAINAGVFTLDDFDQIWDEVREPTFGFIKFDADEEPIRTSDAVVTVVTKTRYQNRQFSNDYLNFVFTQPNTVCDPENENDWYLIARSADWQSGFYIDFNRFLGLRGDTAYDVPAIMPVVDYISGISDKAFVTQGNTKLYGSYPNPALDQTTIKFELIKPATTIIRISNLGGKIIHQEIIPYMQAGLHEYTYNTRNLPCGAYFYSIQSGASGIAGKFMVEK